ncbi:MAG: undecaprenyldiphospho-muramoylpentapeptide beta-N-acetylglucosaminyltransferase [Planctomycetota bacterium]
MAVSSCFFAGGGTGGHIYPAVAVAEQIARFSPDVSVHFFCSDRSIDSQILNNRAFNYTTLPAITFSWQIPKAVKFFRALYKSYKAAMQTLRRSRSAVVVGIGGFASVGPVLAARRLGIPICLLNVDIIPGKANRILARFAEVIFVQFEETINCFTRTNAKIWLTGCPVRNEFYDEPVSSIRRELDLDDNRKILLVMGGSSGARRINEAVCGLLDKIARFADSWQIVHLTGSGDFENVRKSYENTGVKHRILDYCEQIAGLLRQADLLIGRSGAVSIAEYAIAGVPSICIPYPHHKDRHQYLNAEKLVEAGAAVVVDDLDDVEERKEWLWEELEDLLSDDVKRQAMHQGCGEIRKPNAAAEIATRLIDISSRNLR